MIVGNWKMHGRASELSVVSEIAKRIAECGTDRQVVICPPATLLMTLRGVIDPCVALGAQDCHAAAAGAHTGDLSAGMLADAGATHVILGHSERRVTHGETNALVARKVLTAWEQGLLPIICVGESLADREAGQALPAVVGQLDASLPETPGAAAFAVAYEPVWSIGTGRLPTTLQIQEMHQSLRRVLKHRLGTRGRSVPLLYGGSVGPGNATELLAIPNVDGLLVGGASLRADSFLEIVRGAACKT